MVYINRKVGGDKMLTIDEVMKEMKIKSRHVIEDWIEKGCPVIKVGKIIRFELNMLKPWLYEQTKKEAK